MTKDFFGLSLFVKAQDLPQHHSVEKQNEHQACGGHPENIRSFSLYVLLLSPAPSQTESQNLQSLEYPVPSGPLLL